MLIIKIEAQGEMRGDVQDVLRQIVTEVGLGYTSGKGWDMTSEEAETPQDPQNSGGSASDTTENAPEGGKGTDTPPAPPQGGTGGAPIVPTDQGTGGPSFTGNAPGTGGPELMPWEKACEGCDGAGRFTIPAHQSGGDIVDEVEQECALCKGTGKTDTRV